MIRELQAIVCPSCNGDEDIEECPRCHNDRRIMVTHRERQRDMFDRVHRIKGNPDEIPPQA